jgi:hypothetical protein
MVSLIGCTVEERIPNVSDSPPDTEVVINPLVAFIGSTDEISTPHNLNSIPTVSRHVHKVPDPVICDLSPDDDDDDDPFDIPPPLSPPRPSSQFSFLNTSSPSTTLSTVPQSLNPNALNFQPTQNASLSPPPGVIPSSPINCSTIPNATDPDQTNPSADVTTEASKEFVEKWSSSFADILIDEGHKVTIIDVTCPFENGDDALTTADYNKLIKYDHLKQYFHQLGVKCNLFAFVIGALCTWHPNNEAVLNQLRMSKTYKSLFRKLCCSDVIRVSAEIYYSHMNDFQ